MARLELANVSKSYGAFDAIQNVSLAIEDGEFAVFVGPSGCGKSTLLRLIAGLDPISDGAIRIGADDVTRRPAGTRSVAMVFQSYALYPHMTVFDNIAFPLQMEKRAKADIRQQVERAANTVQLTTRLKDRPAKLSGGQRQRVAIARAIVRKPDIFLMDEPLSNLDAALRIEMRSELTQLHKTLGATMVYVTHDQLEAMTMADRIVVLNGGKVEQVGTPMDLYHYPANRFVGGFIGSPPMNMLAARVLGNGAFDVAGVGQVVMPRLGRKLAEGVAVTLGIRPEHLGSDVAEGGFTARIMPHNVERLGAQTMVHARIDDQNFTCVLSGDRPLTQGEAITVGCKADRIHVFDESGLTVAKA
ncbi:ABC transporter ATP-binding protein [Paracoccus litorisediminis]|uniref:sn-glycerol-3-phosphate ABC transporter ATP-binding protein UgpC n=1 Tax=Paracoccus litorisediminis TaxID=2006130 RepID=A0A844HXI4_9RHOB|nr:ABC transporter ATP-binding protein [Paracoccus litorisediminis]MTH62172.1 sn-glycerol-3-phosphate ABC transporter ATP-binding protein UgpC [Paracoccus litorisediminis]